MNYTPLNAIHRVWTFYRDGFRQMTWGRTLWIIILLKLFVIFVVLRIFFFQPMLKGLDDAQKSEQVGRRLKKRANQPIELEHSKNKIFSPPDNFVIEKSSHVCIFLLHL